MEKSTEKSEAGKGGISKGWSISTRSSGKADKEKTVTLAEKPAEEPSVAGPSSAAMGKVGAFRVAEAAGKTANAALAASSVESRAVSRLNQGCKVKGELHLSGESSLDCRVEGQVFSSGRLTLTKNAEVKGKIHAEQLIVQGKVEGDIVCSERLELHSGGAVFGKISSPRIVMHDGVRFEGECSMSKGSGAKDGELRISTQND